MVPSTYTKPTNPQPHQNDLVEVDHWSIMFEAMEAMQYMDAYFDTQTLDLMQVKESSSLVVSSTP